jgi:hypothetical protein
LTTDARPPAGPPADRAGLAVADPAEGAAALDRAGRDNPLLGLATTPIEGGAPSSVLAAAGRAGAGAAATGPAAVLVDGVAGWLGIDEPRVAASLVLLGYSARLVGPGIAVLLREGILPDLRPAGLSYAFTPARGFRLGAPDPAGWRAGRQVLLAWWCRDVLDEHLAPVIAAVRRVVPVAEALLWGNVASGLAGALRAVADGGYAPLAECRAAGDILLGYGPLGGAGELTERGGRLAYRRRSCCLYYRIDGGGTCGDCPLPPGTTRAAR